MSIVLNDNLKINVGNPIDSKYLNNLNAPYIDVNQVNSSISQSLRYSGLTVNVGGSEYWYRNGITDVDLIIKTTGGGSGVTTGINGLTAYGTCVGLGGTLDTGTTYIQTQNSSKFLIGTPPLTSVGGIVLLERCSAVYNCNYAFIAAATNSSNKTYMCVGPSGLTIGGSAVGFPGVTYNADYSANYTNRSLVDKGYVLSVTAGGINACNGLTKSGSAIILGGTLTGNTSIKGNYTLSICCNTKLNTTCGLQISGTTIFDVGRRSIDSIYIGRGAGSVNELPNSCNIGIGSYSMIGGGVPGCNNVAIGYCSVNGSGQNNIGIGNGTFCAAGSTICDNVGIGFEAMRWNSSTMCNIGIGTQVLFCGDYACDNIALGHQALYAGCYAWGNIALGQQALYKNDCGCYNVAIGSAAMCENLCGFFNVAIGAGALAMGTTTNDNVAIGIQAMSCCNGGASNVAIGSCSMMVNDAGYGNVANGSYTLLSNTFGEYNVAIGQFGMCSNTIGCSNIGVGAYALNYNSIGCENIGIGGCGLFCNNNGKYNVGVGTCAGLRNVTGCSNIFIGNKAGSFETTSNKLYISNSSTVRPLIYGDFTTKCITVHGDFKTSGTTSLLVAPVSGSGSDAILVWNSSDKIIKQIPQSSGSGDKNNIYSKTTVTGSTLLTTGSTYAILVNHSAPVSITLPASPVDGEVFKIKDASTTGAGTNNITISRNGKNIDRVAADAIIDTNGGALELMYDATLGWFNLSTVN